MPRVLLVSYHFPPSKAVGALRTGRLAQALTRLGFEVRVVCASTSHADRDGPPADDVVLFPDVPVHRVESSFVFGRDPRLLPSDRFFSRAGWKLRAYTEWVFLTRDWTWRWGMEAASVVRRLLSEQEYDAMLVDAPPNHAIAPSVAVARDMGVPVVLDLRDVWAEAEESVSGLDFLSPRLRRTAWNVRLRDETLRSVAEVVLTSSQASELMRARLPSVPPDRFSVIHNGYVEYDGEPPTPLHAGPGDPLRIVYTGALAYGRRDQVIRLIRGMAEAERRGGPRVDLVVVGTGVEGIDDEAAAAGVGGSVTTRDWIDRDEALALQRSASALLLLQPQDNFWARVAIPAKFFEYMARRRNIFGLLGGSPSATILQAHNLGVVADSESPADIADALVRLADQVEARPYLPSPPAEFSVQEMTRRMAEVLTRVIVTSPASPGGD